MPSSFTNMICKGNHPFLVVCEVGYGAAIFTSEAGALAWQRHLAGSHDEAATLEPLYLHLPTSGSADR